MTLYRYEAVAANGAIVAGEREAGSQDEIVVWLQRLGHIPIRADASRAPFLARSSSFGGFSLRPGSGFKLVPFTQQFATLLHAGLSLDRALEITREGVADRRGKEVVQALIDRVRGGSSLAEALATQSDIFPKFYIGMIRAGEAGATLDTTLQHIADLSEKSQATRDQIKSALIYPSVVLATGAASLSVLFGVVIPRFRPMFAQTGASLPSSAAMMMEVADLVQNYWWAAAILLAGLLAFAIRYYRSQSGRLRWDQNLLRMPLVGGIVTRIEIARFGRTLGTLLKNGVPPVSALAVTRDTIGNRAIAQALAPLADSLKEGKGLAAPLGRSGVVPSLALQLIRVGEETARLEDMLLKVAEIFEASAKRDVDRLLALLVPAITILLGAVVALVMGSLLQAMMSVYDIPM